MSPEDLVAAVRARLDELERLAQAANVKQDDPEWWVSEVKASGGRNFTVRSSRVAADRRILRRHARVKDNVAEKLGFDAPDMCVCCWVTWPCSDFRDLVDGLGIDLEGDSQ